MKITVDGICALCGKPSECTHHLCGGSGKRKISDEDGLTIPLCNECHNMAVKPEDRIHGNPVAEKLSKMLGQIAWEKDYVSKGGNEDEAREAFREKMGKCYL